MATLMSFVGINDVCLPTWKINVAAQHQIADGTPINGCSRQDVAIHPVTFANDMTMLSIANVPQGEA